MGTGLGRRRGAATGGRPGPTYRRSRVAELVPAMTVEMSRVSGNTEVEAIATPPGIAVFAALVKQLPNYGHGESTVLCFCSAIFSCIKKSTIFSLRFARTFGQLKPRKQRFSYPVYRA